MGERVGVRGGTQAIRPVTRLMLESTLYQLTAVGGPRYLTRRVNSAAFVALDQLFPRGQWSRRLISWACRLLHPTEWCPPLSPPPTPPAHARAHSCSYRQEGLLQVAQ